MISLWDLRTGDFVDLAGDVVAEVLAPTEDGEWVPVIYREVSDPEDRWLLGMQDLAHVSELVARRWEHVN
ncbi:MAG: hypothetical protein WHT63_11635 [Tepidiforma sp.]